MKLNCRQNRVTTWTTGTVCLLSLSSASGFAFFFYLRKQSFGSETSQLVKLRRPILRGGTNWFAKPWIAKSAFTIRKSGLECFNSAMKIGWPWLTTNQLNLWGLSYQLKMARLSLSTKPRSTWRTRRSISKWWMNRRWWSYRWPRTSISKQSRAWTTTIWHAKPWGWTTQSGDIIQGDITNYEDRRLLHTTPQPLCGMITCGVPCQRLSVQGDGRGNEDERAKPFHAARKACWEQQAAAILLERVPRSGSWEWKSTKRSSHWAQRGHADAGDGWHWLFRRSTTSRKLSWA